MPVTGGAINIRRTLTVGVLLSASYGKTHKSPSAGFRGRTATRLQVENFFRYTHHCQRDLPNECPEQAGGLVLCYTRNQKSKMPIGCALPGGKPTEFTLGRSPSLRSLVDSIRGDKVQSHVLPVTSRHSACVCVSVFASSSSQINCLSLFVSGYRTEAPIKR